MSEKIDKVGNKESSKKKLVSLVIAIFVYLIMSQIEPPEGLSVNGWRAIALIISATITWVSEYVPIGISSSMLLFLPSILGIDKTGNIMKNFATPTLFFIFSSLLIAKVFMKVGFGKRVSVYLIGIFGNKSRNVLFGLMCCSALISFFLADIPSGVIVGAIAYEILKKSNCTPGKSSFGKSVMIGIPFSAAVGGIATPAGSGVNILSINLLKSVAGIEIGFLQWSIVGVPVAILLTIVSWFVISKLFKPEFEIVEGLGNIKEEKVKLGKMSRDEKIFVIVFAATILLWVTSSLTSLETAFVSMLAVTIFFLPGINILDWKEAKDAISWETLLLVGSCNALAMILSDQGSAKWLSDTLLSGFMDSPLIILLFAVTTFGIFIHLLVPISGAVMALTIPIIAAMAQTIGIDPIYLVLPLAYTASCVFLIPLDPTALTTYGYGYWDLKEMPKPGFIVGVIWIPILVFIMFAAIKLRLI